MSERQEAVRASGASPIELVLQAEAGGPGRPAADAADRRAIHADAVLRGAQDGRLAAIPGRDCEQETGEASDAQDGLGGHLSEAQLEPGQCAAQEIPLPAQRAG